MEIVRYNNRSKTNRRNNMRRRNPNNGYGAGPIAPLFRNLRSYANQPLATHVIPAGSYLLTPTGGTVASATPVDPTTLINGWATRFQTLYEEYRVVKVKAQVNFFSSTNPGILASYWDEKTPYTTPTVAIVQQRSTFKTSLSSTDRPLNMTWVPRDLLDLEYTAIGTAVSPVAICFYTDSANYGSGGGITNFAEVSLFITIQFRGFQSGA